MAFAWLFHGPHLLGKTVFGRFSWLFRGFSVAFSWPFRGPHFGQILRVLALEKSSERVEFLGCTRRGSYSPKGRVSAF